MSINQVLSYIIHGTNNICCLCFQEVTAAESVWINDEVFVDSQDIRTISELLNMVLGDNMLNSVSACGVFCDQCKVSLINSYKFKKMCEENMTILNNVIDSVSVSFDNLLPYSNYSTLYVTIDPHDFSTKQFYDAQHNINVLNAFERFCCIVDPIIKPVTGKKRYPHILKYLLTKDDQEKLKSELKREDVKVIKQTAMNQKRHITPLRKSRSKEHNVMIYDIPSYPTSKIITNDKDITTYKCKSCFKKFREESILRKHFFKKHYPRKVKCTKCPRSFISVEMLANHEDDCHHPGVCTHCGKNFTSKYSLQKHERQHNVCITCEECGRVYQSVEAYKKHKTDDVCRQKSKKSADQANFECDVCSKRYCYKPYLAKHIMYEHGNAVGFLCQFCNKQFYTKSRLETHVLKHTREKKFLCTICDNFFGTKAALIYHTRLHTGEKPYQCEYCDKAFLSSSRRLDHVRRNHLAPSFECNICHIKFKATGCLLRHKKRHADPNSKLNKKFKAELH